MKTYLKNAPESMRGPNCYYEFIKAISRERDTVMDKIRRLFNK